MMKVGINMILKDMKDLKDITRRSEVLKSAVVCSSNLSGG